MQRNGVIHAEQTNLALDQCTGDWCFYIQADEVVHENQKNKVLTTIEQKLERKFGGKIYISSHRNYKLIGNK